MIKFGDLRAQAHFDVPQTRPISELGERHASISIRACECFYVFVAVIPGDTLIENGPWQMLHDLEKTKRPENITSSLLVVISDSGMWKSVRRKFNPGWHLWCQNEGSTNC